MRKVSKSAAAVKTVSKKTSNGVQKLSFWQKVKKDFSKNKGLYVMILPVLAFYIIFQYGPMFGLSIAFMDYTPGKGFFESPWVGLKHFDAFFHDFYFGRVLKNTIIIAVVGLIFSFPSQILLALMINELKNKTFSRIVQSITYMPHFISIVVICSMIIMLTSRDGAITAFLSLFGFEKQTMLNRPDLFLPIYIISNIWQNVGWGSIIFLSALTGIDPGLYEAAKIDGAGRFRQLISVTLPGILPTIIIMFILEVGKMFNVGHEKILLLYNPITYETADVISTYVYRKGLLEANWSFSTAVGMFNSVVSFCLVYFTNRFSRRSGTSLW